MWRVWCGIGSAVWLATICASAMVNYLAGYGFGSTPLEAHVFAVLGVSADLWKAVGPIFVVILFRSRKLFAAALGGLVWILCFIFAVTAALGVAAKNRESMVGGRDALRLRYETSSKELTEAEERRERLGSVSAPSEREAAIAQALARPLIGGTVSSLSDNCAKDHFRARKACAEVADLKLQLAISNEARQLDEQVTALRREVADLRDRGGLHNDDPQADLISRLTLGQIGKGEVGLMLTLIVVAMVEVISAFAPVVLHEYVAAHRGLSRPVGAGRAAPRTVAGGRGNGRRSRAAANGNLYEYVAERIRPDEEGMISSSELFADYASWCEAKGLACHTARKFVELLDGMAADDMGGRVMRRGSEYRGLKIAVDSPTAG